MEKPALFFLLASGCTLQIVKVQAVNYSSLLLCKEVNFNHLPQHPRLFSNNKKPAFIQLQKDVEWNHIVLTIKTACISNGKLMIQAMRGSVSSNSKHKKQS